jgi:hypothetical protein
MVGGETPLWVGVTRGGGVTPGGRRGPTVGGGDKWWVVMPRGGWR